MGGLSFRVNTHKKKSNLGLKLQGYGFWTQRIDNKIRPWEVYITVNLNNAGNEKDYTIKEEVEINPQWEKESIVVKLFYIIEIY